MEAGLKVLAKELGIPCVGNPTYAKFTRLSMAIGNPRLPTKRMKQPFYKEVAGDLQSVKIAWRNPTMHIVKSYDGREAEQIYDCVHTFMVRLAESGLSE